MELEKYFTNDESHPASQRIGRGTTYGSIAEENGFAGGEDENLSGNWDFPANYSFLPRSDTFGKQSVWECITV
jgi:hypothetical protein